MGEAERVFAAGGTWRTTMDMVLTGENGARRPGVQASRAPRAGSSEDDLLLYGLEIAAHGGHWVEFSRPFCAGTPSQETLAGDGGLRGVRRRRARDDEGGRDRARRPHGRLEGLPRPRLQARPCHRPLDRDDDDRVPADRRGQRVRAAREHGDLDAPARDHRRTTARASTCRTRGASLRRAGCRSRRCRSGSSARARSSGDSRIRGRRSARAAGRAARPP